MVKLAEVQSYGNAVVVWLKTDLGYFDGVAHCHPDDKEHYSEIFGGRLAETRAWKKYCKARMKEVKKTGETISKFMENCIHYKNFDTNTKEFKIMNKEFTVSCNKYTIWKDYYDRCCLHEKELISSKEVTDAKIDLYIAANG